MSEAHEGSGPAPSAADASARIRSEQGPARKPATDDLPRYLPARMLNEFVYCPRLFFYEWVEGLFAHNADTIEGALRHGGLDEKQGALPPANRKKAGGIEEGEQERIHARSVRLASDRYRLVAVIDLVEAEGDHATPVDYKKGRPREGADGPEAWPADTAQVSAQALILRDNGYKCDEAVLYYSATRQRVRVTIDEEVVGRTLAALADARALARRRRPPPPLLDSPKCPRCSLVGICLPDETLAAPAAGEAPSRQLELFPSSNGEPAGERPPKPDGVRRLVPARDDLRPLYVAGNGLRIGKSGGVLRIKDRSGKVIQESRLNEISQVNVFGNNIFTAAAVHGLCELEKPVAHFSYGGWFYGTTQGLGLRNVFLRRDQFRRADQPAFCLRVARAIVRTKIRNQRTLLKRNHVEPPRPSLYGLQRLAEQADAARSLDELLGVEGNAARLYFGEFAGMLKATDADGALSFDFTTRNRRPPRDPVNALLSFAYALLTKDLTIVCHQVGFDPFIGFFHQPRFGRPALALDLLEGFRPLVADSCVLSAINTGMVTREGFLRVGDAVAMKAPARRGLIRAYEQRMDALVTHPLFGYRASYRRVLEIQARLLARTVTGEIPSYPGFETR